VPRFGPIKRGDWICYRTLIKGISAESFSRDYYVKSTSIELSGTNCEGNLG